jgi:16S rRNA (uracil1498-N3)-methyltransferase
LDTFLKEYKDVKVFDFCDNIISKELDFENILIGCEGGFSKDEKQKLLSYDVFALDSDFVLRSESAVLSIASKILL